MNKKDLIKKIKENIGKYGSFTAGEIELESSPVYKFMTKDNYCLIDGFNLFGVDAYHYIRETLVDEFSIDYEELDKLTLNDIFNITQEWVEYNKEHETI